MSDTKEETPKVNPRAERSKKKYKLTPAQRERLKKYEKTVEIRKDLHDKRKNLERKIQNHSQKLAYIKNRAEDTREKLQEIQQLADSKGVVSTKTLETLPEAHKEIIEKHTEVVFRPNPGPQEDFLSADEEEVLYGGAAGGGKSYALLAEALRYVHLPACRVLILRKTLDELKELTGKSKEFYKRAFPSSNWVSSEKTWKFSSGATIEFSYLDKDDDVLRYQGQSFTLVCFDELTHWSTPYAYDYLRSRVRTTDPRIKCYIRSTTNPGGPGSWWVKKLFIDPAVPGTPFWATDIEGKTLRYPKDHPEKANKPLFRRRFIPANLKDNPYLWKDGKYEAQLLSLPEIERRRLLEGDWDIVEGAAFPEFKRNLHVLPTTHFEDNGRPPHRWLRVRGGDYGYSSPSAILWAAVDSDNNLYIYRELYEKGLTPQKLGERIRELEMYDPEMHDAVMDESVFNTVGGIKFSDLIGCNFRPSDRDRLIGKLQIHRRLQPDIVSGKPKLFILESCTNLIQELSSIQLSKTNPEDVDTKAMDHAYDALRYICMVYRIEDTNPYSRLGESTNGLPQLPPELVDPTFGY